MKTKVKFLLIVALVITAISASSTKAAEWQQKNEYSDNYGANLTIQATYYAAEYIERSTLDEAKKHLWTADEMEDYRYNLLQQLRLDDTIPIYLKFIVRGPAVHLSPFDRRITLQVGRHRLEPVDFDRRFNFKITDEREGFVYFPRFDKNGKPYMTPKVKTITLDIDGGITPVTLDKNIRFFWDVKDDKPEKIMKGKSGARLEMDRLTKRMSNLTKEGRELNEKLTAIEDEIKKINTRMMELQKEIN